MRLRPNPEDIVEVYLDESSQNKHRYLVLGAIGVKLKTSSALVGLIKNARHPDLPEKEAKWVRVSKTKLSAYKRVVDV